MEAASLAAWVDLIASFASVDLPLVLDIGAGTGVFAAALAEFWKDARPVVGVDRSFAMTSEARRLRRNRRVEYLLGDAAALPIRDVTVDLVLLSRVIHHFPDRVRVARELARVTRAGSRVVIRTTVSERLDSSVYQYWPELLESDRRRFPSEDEITAEFVRAGFDLFAATSFSQPVAKDLGAYRDRMRERPQSKFAFITDEQFRDGLGRMDEDIPRSRTPVEERYDVLVYERSAMAHPVE
jgi:ubiquinone/menaquinone biosynthesis C-methylase UbiE